MATSQATELAGMFMLSINRSFDCGRWELQGVRRGGVHAGITGFPSGGRGDGVVCGAAVEEEKWGSPVCVCTGVFL